MNIVRLCLIVPAILLIWAAAPTPAQGQWIKFFDETDVHLDAPDSLDDTEEKDYAWGDVDDDGDIDLVVVRKEPFTSIGKRPNYLLINENGVLTDRTSEFATAATVQCCGSPADQGFNTPTNDRDVQLADLDLDGWLDMVTATTISDGDPKHIGHPRIYMNLGCSGACAGTEDWLGFRYEEARIPSMLSYTGQSGHNPRFCSVSVGDVTGDGYPELWFGDYDSSGAGGATQDAEADFNDRLLINLGSFSPGYFVDATNGPSGRFTGLVSIPFTDDLPFPVSAFGAAGAIADMNGDGNSDIVKQTALANPLYVGVAYNNAAGTGHFDTYSVPIQGSPYFISVADLNNDDMLDVVVTDDGADRYLLNQGNEVNGTASFISWTFSFSHIGVGGPASDDGIGGNNIAADLDNDGWNDVLITGVDVDIPGCSNRMHIYRNLTGTPGNFVTLQEQTTGSNCQTFIGNSPDCLVAGIPATDLEGVHDVAVFDINQDGWKDLILGRCNSTEVYLSAAFIGFVNLDREIYRCDGTLQIQVDDLSLVGAAAQPVSIGTAAETETLVLTEVTGGVFQGSLPLSDSPPVTGDGTLAVSHGATITVEYVDADDGIGGVNLLRTASASVDCLGPAISNVQIVQNIPQLAAVLWETDEPGDTLVEWGLDPANFETIYDDDLETSHSATITDLQCGAEYLIAVTSVDAVGNSVTDDNGGSYYTAQRECDPVPPVPDGTGGTAPIMLDQFSSVGIWFYWDNQCATEPAKIVYGPLDQLSSYTTTGALCGIPESIDAAVLTQSSLPPEDLWFLLIRDNGEGAEGSWGQSTAGERNGIESTGQCGAVSKDVEAECVP